MDGASARDGLEGGYALLFYCRGVGAEDQFLRCGGELGEAGDGEVFVVEVGVLTEDIVRLEVKLGDDPTSLLEVSIGCYRPS
jgi:hypothetical protein